VFKLTNLGLNPDLFKFGNLSFESQKYICVKDGAVSYFHSSSPIWIHLADLLTSGIAMRDNRHRPELQSRPQGHEGRLDLDAS
jgi:hypothetical protein